MGVSKKEAISKKDGEKYNNRLVAKGYAQREGENNNEIFSLVVKHTSIRMILVLVAMYDLKLEQLTMKRTFHQGDLEEQVFMHQPESLKEYGKEHMVCK